MVPVSWPPWPASITMRLIFRPSARVRERLPSRVGFDSDGGASAADLVLSDFDSEFRAGAGGVFALPAVVFAAGFVAVLVALAPIAAVLLSAAAVTFASSATAASLASSFSDSGLSATTSTAAGFGAGAGAGVGGAACAGACCAVVAALDFTSITRRYGFASK